MAKLDFMNKSESTLNWTHPQIEIIEGGDNFRVNEEVEINAMTIAALVTSGLLILPVNIGRH